MAGNRNLNSAKTARKDEFYTQLTDIEKEMRYYRKHFKGKTVLCNCDDPFESNFFKYFVLNFNRLGLKKLIATCYATSPIMGSCFQYRIDDNGQMSFSFGDESVVDNDNKHPYKAVVTQVYDKTGDGGVDMLDIAKLFMDSENELTELNGDGDFRSPECIALLDEADIVVTNPPFSLFREYVSLIVEHQKSFIIIGNQNAISYEETFSLMKSNRMWIGASIHSGDRAFFVPDDYPLDAAGCGIDEETGRKYIRVKGVRWFTNLDIKHRHEEMILVRRYTPDEYPKYVNYDAIEVAKTSDIPCDYAGEMGVPITFMDKYNPDQFEIIGISRELVRTLSDDVRKNGAYPQIGRFYLDVGETKYKKVYERLVIRNKYPEVPKETK
ncbi:MAG: modification methylase [Ruminococcaceae bacterium]|nr:modification methylase [Oscillospiraceae bacterium]